MRHYFPFIKEITGFVHVTQTFLNIEFALTMMTKIFIYHKNLYL